jgi:hypothetical protein
MWGINPFVVGQILGGVLLRDLSSNKHGAPKIIRDKIIVYVANHEITMAKAMARSVAQQDKPLYEKLKSELREKLSEEEWCQIFTG